MALELVTSPKGLMVTSPVARAREARTAVAARAISPKRCNEAVVITMKSGSRRKIVGVLRRASRSTMMTIGELEPPKKRELTSPRLVARLRLVNNGKSLHHQVLGSRLRSNSTRRLLAKRSL
jgi:hypothetical protein